jgi:hypothetical protein
MRSIGSRRAGISVVSLSLIAWLGITWAVTVQQRSRARAFLQEFIALNLGESTFADAQRLAESYGGKPWSPSSQNATCSARSCELMFVFDNKPLRSLPGIRGVYFGAVITVKEGRIVGSSIVVYQRLASSGELVSDGGGPEYEYLYGVRDVAERTDGEYGVTKKEVDAQGIPHFLIVGLGPNSSAEARKRAYSLDLSCLARLNACNTASAIYPPGWQTW